jgi:hypothetical protein
MAAQWRLTGSGRWCLVGPLEGDTRPYVEKRPDGLVLLTIDTNGRPDGLEPPTIDPTVEALFTAEQWAGLCALPLLETPPVVRAKASSAFDLEAARAYENVEILGQSQSDAAETMAACVAEIERLRGECDAARREQQAALRQKNEALQTLAAHQRDAEAGHARLRVERDAALIEAKRFREALDYAAGASLPHEFAAACSRARKALKDAPP